MLNRGLGETFIAIGLVFMVCALLVGCLSGCAKPQRKMDWDRMLDEAGIP